jgi:hypothetical protein
MPEEVLELLCLVMIQNIPEEYLKGIESGTFDLCVSSRRFDPSTR